MSVENGKLVIKRVFDAPVKLIWKMWSEPEFAKLWWGPKIFTCPVAKIDFRVGGKTLLCMRGQEGDFKGKDFWSTGTYKEIVPYKKIVVTDSFSDEQGNVVPASKYGMKNFPDELLVTIEFEEKDGKTEMTLTHSGLDKVDNKMLKDMDQGWNESFDKIDQNVKERENS